MLMLCYCLAFMHLVVVILRVHSKYSHGVSCQFAGDVVSDCLPSILFVRARPCPSQSPCEVEFTTFVVVLLLEDFRCYELFRW